MRRELGIAVSLTTAICLALPMTAALTVAPVAANSPASAGDASDSAPRQNPLEQSPVAELIVKYKPGVKPTEAPGVATGDRSVDDVSLEPGRKMSLGLRIVEMSEAVQATEAAHVARELEADPRIEAVTPNYRVSAAVIPSSAANPADPYFRSSALWGLNGTYGIDAPSVWAVTTGLPSVVVAVLDTGIQSHPDLAASSQVAGFDMIADIDGANDGDGRDADPTDPGDGVTSYESADAGSGYYGCDPKPSSWHGTHVAGTINATNGNGIGVSSVAPGVKIQSVRVLGKCDRGTLDDLIDGIAWASGALVPGVAMNSNPAHVINMSLGFGTSCNQIMQSAIDAAVVRGTTVIVAAGNETVNASLVSPAGCDKVVTVGATTPQGKRASFSNYGSRVDLAAPGEGILSTFNAGTHAPGAPRYQSRDGTSMAAPHVAGLAALVKSVNPGLSPAQVEARLKATTRSFAGGSCHPGWSCGSGIANSAAVTGRVVVPVIGPTKPGRVRTIKAIYKRSKTVVKWTAPTENGRAKILGYHYRIAKNGGRWSAWRATKATKKAIHRTQQAKYSVQVAPTNSAGRGTSATLRLKRR